MTTETDKGTAGQASQHQHAKGLQPESILTKGKETKSGTLRPIELDLTCYRGLEFIAFVDKIHADLKCLKDERFNYYDNQRARSYANLLRTWLVWLAAIAAVLTAIATVVRIGLVGQTSTTPYDIYLFAGAMLLYAAMGAIGIFNTGKDVSSRYFRHLGIAMAIRDQWTKLEFALLKESLSVQDGDAIVQAAARDRIVEFAEAFCADLAKLVSDEFGEWRTEFIASISELDAIAKKGKEGAQKDLENAAKEFRAAAAKAEAAEKAAAEAAKPALLNVQITGDYDNKVTVRVNNAEMITTDKKAFAIERVVPGDTKIEAVAKKGDKEVSCVKWVTLKPGIQELPLTLR